MLPENILPVDLAGLHLRDGGVPAVIRAQRRSHAIASLSKIEAVSHQSAYAIVLDPAQERLVNASLIHEILKQPPDKIVGQHRHNCRVQSEAPRESTGNVIFSSSLVDVELAGGRNPSITGIKAEHHLAKADQVPSTFPLRPDVQSHGVTLNDSASHRQLRIRAGSSFGERT